MDFWSPERGFVHLRVNEKGYDKDRIEKTTS